MKEEFICFLWQYRLYDSVELTTTSGEQVKVISPGTYNYDSGPDFFAARVEIDGTILVGNIEIHINSSNWYHHRHHNDAAYSNIILHVVMNHDREILDMQNNLIPVIELQNKFDKSLLDRYTGILASKNWVACEKFISSTNCVVLTSWLSRLLVERLERKAAEIREFYEYFGNNWEQTFYYFLSRNFGFKVNASPFALLAQQTPYSLLAKLKNDPIRLEALLFGQAGMLHDKFKDAYPALLLKEYQFLRHKYNLTPIEKSLWKHSKLRPSNFPSIRISQFAQLVFRSTGLFSKLIETNNINQLKELLTVTCTAYWRDHYLFDKQSVSRDKSLGTDAVTNILINTIVPLKFVYGTDTLRHDLREGALNLLTSLQAERNSIILNWIKIGIQPSNAGEGQALLELKKNYCTPKKCLRCSIGHHFIRKS